MAHTAFVTGASGGIGSAVARDLGRDHDVIVHYYSDREGAERVAEAVRERGQDAFVAACDVSDPAAIAEVVDEAREALGPVDVLINNAGVLRSAALETASDDAIQGTIRVNLEGALYATRAVLPDMLEEGAGRIVNVSSTAGTTGSPTDAGYGASKSGLIGLTRSLAKQYTDDGILTNTVAPGPTETDMFDESRRPEAREESPIDRLVTPAEVAEAVRFFVETSSITGQTLTVDGGLRTL